MGHSSLDLISELPVSNSLCQVRSGTATGQQVWDQCCLIPHVVTRIELINRSATQRRWEQLCPSSCLIVDKVIGLELSMLNVPDLITCLFI